MLINHDQNMLCLDEFDILELRENADECDYLFVVSPKIETKLCTKCGSCNVVNYGRYTKLVRDININEHYTALKIRGHKHLCKDCGSIFVDRFNTLDLCSKMTNRLRCKIQQLSLTKPFKHIARDGKGYSFEILRGKVLYGQAYKTKAIFSYNKFSPTVHYVTGHSTRSSLNMIQNLMNSYKQISGAEAATDFFCSSLFLFMLFLLAKISVIIIFLSYMLCSLPIAPFVYSLIPNCHILQHVF